MNTSHRFDNDDLQRQITELRRELKWTLLICGLLSFSLFVLAGCVAIVAIDHPRTEQKSLSNDA